MQGKSTPRTYTQQRKIVEQLLAAWAEHPHMRLGQLIMNATKAECTADVFYCTDDKLIERVQALGSE